MAGSIKGITIEIGGNTSKLTQALKEPQKETQSLRNRLKDVNASLKFDTKNVELLDKKQRLLTKTIESTENELQLLKEAQRQYVASGGDIDGEEYIALEKKISITTKALENLQAQQSNFNGELQAMGLKVGEFGEKATDLGKKFLPVTAAVAGVGTAATAAWSELDDAYDGIAAGTGATGDALKELHENFNNVYGRFPAESAEVGTAIADINTRFGLTGKALETASEQFLKFAKVNSQDVGASIEYVAKAMADAGIPTEELGATLDKLTVASQASGLDVGVLSDALSKNGINMRELGYNTDETIAILTTFEKKGVDVSTVLTGFKGVVKNTAKEGKNAKEEIEKFFTGIQEGSVTAAEAQELFGAKAGAAIFNYAREGKLNLSDMMQVVQDSAGGLENTFQEMKDPADDLQVAWNNVKIAGAELGDAMQQTVAPILEKFANKMRELAEWFGSLSEETKKNIVVFGGLAAAIGPALIAVGKLSSAFSGLITYFGSTTTLGGKLIASFKGLFATGSIGVGTFAAIAASVAAVVAAFMTLWNTSEDFRDSMIEIWNEIVSKIQEFTQGIVERINAMGFEFKNIVEVISAVWMEFCNLLAPIFEGAFQAISNSLTYTLDMIMGAIDIFTGLFSGNWDQLWQGVQTVFSGAWDFIISTLQNILNMFTGLIQTFLGWFGVEWETNWQSSSDFFVNIWNGIVDFGTRIWNTLSSIFSGVWNAISGTFSAVMGAISSTASSIWNGISSFLSGCWNNISSTASSVWNSVSNSIINPLNAIWNSVSSIFGNIYSFISEKMNAASSAVGNAINAIKGFFNFQFRWPHIPLPHFRISGSLNPLDWLKGGLPSIGVDWYAKAMNNGFIMNQPTAFGINSFGQIMAGGEAGPEAVVGVNSLRQMIYGAVDSAAMRKLEQIRRVQDTQQVQGVEIDYDRLAGAVLAGMSGVVIQNSVNIGLKQVLNEMLPLIDAGLEKRKKRR